MSDDAVRRDAAALFELVTQVNRLRSIRDPISGNTDLELTPVQVHAVLWLGLDGSLPISALAHRIGSSAAGSTGIVDRLERSGLVTRERDTQDRRVVRVALTPRGEQISALVREEILGRMTLMFSHLSQKDRRGLLAIAGRLVEALQAAPESE